MAMYGRYHGRSNEELVQHLKRKCRATVMQCCVIISHADVIPLFALTSKLFFFVDLRLENTDFFMKKRNIYNLLSIFESKDPKTK